MSIFNLIHPNSPYINVLFLIYHLQRQCVVISEDLLFSSLTCNLIKVDYSNVDHPRSNNTERNTVQSSLRIIRNTQTDVIYLQYFKICRYCKFLTNQEYLVENFATINLFQSKLNTLPSVPTCFCTVLSNFIFLCIFSLTLIIIPIHL